MIKDGKGGANTNKNGLAFEARVDLGTLLEAHGYAVIKTGKGDVLMKGEQQLGILVPKHELYRYLKSLGRDWDSVLSKRLLPDNAFVNTTNSTVYIVEVKFQETSGSVDEKLQTCHYKKQQYEKLFEGLNLRIEFMYVLNDWFKKPEYRDTLNYVEESGCRYYFGAIPPEDIGL
jgi:hypothetical protein